MRIRRRVHVMPIDAVHRSGLVVVAGGSLVRMLQVTPWHRAPGVAVTAPELETGLTAVLADVPVGGSLQFRAEVVPCQLDPAASSFAAAVAKSLDDDPLLIAQTTLECHVVVPYRPPRGSDGPLGSLA